jgi:hypothetical protein
MIDCGGCFYRLFSNGTAVAGSFIRQSDRASRRRVDCHGGG